MTQAMQTPQGLQTRPPSAIAGADPGYLFAAEIVPVIPRHWVDLTDDAGKLICTGAEAFAKQMELLQVRREIELRTHNIRSAEATSRHLGAEAGRLQQRLDQGAELQPLDREVIAGQRDCILEDVAFSQVQMRRWEIERQMFLALVRNPEKE